MKRRVTIQQYRDGFHVLYVERSYRQRYCAATFDSHKPDGSVRTLDDVKAWIESQHDIELTPNPRNV